VVNPTHKRVSQLFAALSHPTRLEIVERLCTEEKTVNELAAELHLSQSSTSQHLAVLTRAGLLTVKPHGVSRYYRIRGSRIERIINLMTEFCEVHGLRGTNEAESEVSQARTLHSLSGVAAEEVLL
jgi:DNA-binding transcriptional ArsR family regulator